VLVQRYQKARQAPSDVPKTVPNKKQAILSIIGIERQVFMKRRVPILFQDVKSSVDP
jgi:hypothetical protein